MIPDHPYHPSQSLSQGGVPDSALMEGVTCRDKIAIAAMQGLLSRDYKQHPNYGNSHKWRVMAEENCYAIARRAYAIANAMIKESNKQKD